MNCYDLILQKIFNNILRFHPIHVVTAVGLTAIKAVRQIVFSFFTLKSSNLKLRLQ